MQRIGKLLVQIFHFEYTDSKEMQDYIGGEGEGEKITKGWVQSWQSTNLNTWLLIEIHGKNESTV